MIRVLGTSETCRLPLKLARTAEVVAESGCSASVVSSRDEDGGLALGPEFRLLVQIQLPDDLQSQQIALQNPHFGIEVGRVVIIDAAG